MSSIPHRDFEEETRPAYWADDHKGQIALVQFMAGSWSWIVFDADGKAIGGRRSWGMDAMTACDEAIRFMGATR